MTLLPFAATVTAAALVVAQALPPEIAAFLNYGVLGTVFILVVTGKLRLERELREVERQRDEAVEANTAILEAAADPAVLRAVLEAVDTMKKMLQDLQEDWQNWEREG